MLKLGRYQPQKIQSSHLKQSQRHQQVAKQQLCRNCARASRVFLYFFVVVARPRRKTFLISRLVEEANSGLRFSIVF